MRDGIAIHVLRPEGSIKDDRVVVTDWANPRANDFFVFYARFLADTNYAKFVCEPPEDARCLSDELTTLSASDFEVAPKLAPASPKHVTLEKGHAPRWHMPLHR